MKPLLFLIQPYDPVAGARVDVRVASVPSPVYSGMGGNVWEGTVSRRPRFMQDLMSPRLDGKTITAKGDFMLNLGQLKNVSQPTALNWNGAPVTIWDATSMDPANMPVEFKGTISNQTLDVWTSQLIINLEVDIARLDRPLLPGEFTGGGGLLGDADKRGTPYPAGFGYNENCEPVWFDAVNNVGMLDGYGNLTSIAGLYEGGANLGASFGDYASYALLVAAAIPPGRWGTCLTAGLVRLGAPPAGRISADATFRGAAGTGANRSGGVIRRILETQASIATADLDTVSLAALDTSVPYNIHYWTAAQRSCQDLCEAIASAANATLIVLLNGTISVTRAFGGATAGTVNRTSTSAPPVTDWQLAAPEEPVWRMRARTGRPGTVFQFSDVMYEDNLIDMGVFAIGTTYRQGNLVWLADGSQWLWINATPAAGHTPPASPTTSDAYWQRTKPPTTAADLVYGDGTTIESLKPAAPGATRNIIYRQTTDPVLAVSIFNGDIWVDTSSGIDVTNVRQSGVWQISATANFVTYSATPPGSPVNGAIWVDTSVTPNVVRIRIAGVWQASSNLVTQGTDIGVSNGAGTTVVIVPVGSDLQGVGNSVRRISAAGGVVWNAGFNTADARIAGAFMQFTNVGTANTYMIGLTDTPITNAVNNYNQISYAAYVNTTGLDAYVNGASRSLSATIAANDVVSIAYDNISIRLYKTTAAGVTTLIDTFPTTAGRRFLCSGTILNVTAANTFAAVGIRSDPFTNQNFADMGGATRPADNAGTTLTLVAVGTPVTIIGNTVYRTNSGTWDSGFNSVERYVGGAAATFRPNTLANAFMIGLSSTAVAAVGSTNYTALDFAFYITGTGTYQIYEGGVAAGTFGGTPALTDVLTITYDGLSVRYYINGGSPVRTVAAPANQGYRLAGSLPTLNAGGVALGLTPFSNNDFQQTGGIGRPSDNATSNLTLATGSYSTSAHTIVGNTITRASANSAQWDSFVGSKESFKGNASITFTFGLALFDTMAGLSATPQGYVSDWRFQYSAINYGVYQTGSSAYQIYELGVLVENLGTSKAGVTFSIATVWRIDYDGVNVRYYADGVLMHTTAAAANLVLYAGVSILQLGGLVARLSLTTFTDNNWTSIPNGPANVFALGGTEDIRNTLVTATVDTAGTGGRARVGILTNGISTGGPALLPTTVQNLDQQWSDVQNAAGTKPANYAGTTLTLTAIGAAMTTLGNSVARSNSGTWDHGFNSGERYVGGAAVTFTPSISNAFMVGLCSTSMTNGGGGGANYTLLDFAFYIPGNGTYQIYESGSAAGTFGGTPALTDILTITYDGVSVRYYINGGSPVRTVAASASLGLRAAGAFAGNASASAISLVPFVDRYLDNMGDGTNYAKLPTATSTGSGTSRRALVDFTQAHTNKNLDNVGDGSTYARPLAAELTSGVPKLGVTGSGKKLGDTRNMPNVAAMNLGYKWTAAITYTSAAGTPATATISVAAGGFTSGSYAPSYSAMSANVTGTGGTTVTYFLYVNDPTNAAGAQTLIATTTALNVYSGDGYIYVGTCDVFFPASGTGGGGGGGGGGGCPWADAWVDTMRGPVRARDVIPGEDWILCETLDRRGMEWVLCESNQLAWEYGGRIIAEDGREVTVSSSTPILPRGHERLMPVIDLDCQELSVPVGAVLDWSPCRYVPEPEILEVAKLKVHNRIYSAGNIAGQSIMTHNPNPKP